MQSWRETFGKLRPWPRKVIPTITAWHGDEAAKAGPVATVLSFLAGLSHAANGLLVMGLLIGVPFLAFTASPAEQLSLNQLQPSSERRPVLLAESGELEGRCLRRCFVQAQDDLHHLAKAR